MTGLLFSSVFVCVCCVCVFNHLKTVIIVLFIYDYEPHSIQVSRKHVFNIFRNSKANASEFLQILRTILKILVLCMHIHVYNKSKQSNTYHCVARYERVI